MTSAKSLTASIAAVALASAIGMALAQGTTTDLQDLPADSGVTSPSTPAAIDRTAPADRAAGATMPPPRADRS